ncbi:ABC-type Na+ transport system ATPase subunit NatA [Roseospira visakhapatnamensis]|uniref:ABC-type Na+ transport system ATPase subunit NatA n=1 Tax=Roseospira visakhapatnamensis TaxID=390880 RepID=A0A7W6RFZ3_9PROT|nr:ABC-type Na+ transport system ATPase subunit NatA [Roseospira visakhapatnamensis]
MGKLHLNSSFIINYSVRIVQTEDYPYVFVEIFTEAQSLSYKIVTDENFSDINYIYQRLQNGISSAANNVNDNLEIGEYLERNYVFFTYPDGTQDKYTAFRIE